MRVSVPCRKFDQVRGMCYPGLFYCVQNFITGGMSSSLRDNVGKVVFGCWGKNVETISHNNLGHIIGYAVDMTDLPSDGLEFVSSQNYLKELFLLLLMAHCNFLQASYSGFFGLFTLSTLTRVILRIRNQVGFLPFRLFPAFHI